LGESLTIREADLATVKRLNDSEAWAILAVRAAFDDIRTTRKTDIINNL
jgi:hypothetical protein